MRVSLALVEYFDAHVSALLGPFVGLLGEYCADEADDAARLGKMPTTIDHNTPNCRYGYAHIPLTRLDKDIEIRSSKRAGPYPAAGRHQNSLARGISKGLSG